MKKGFTLLEMIVVILVVAALTLLTIPNISKVMNTVDNKACDALIKVVDSAILEFKLEYGELPRNIKDLVSAGFLSEDQLTCSGGKELFIDDGQTYAK